MPRMGASFRAIGMDELNAWNQELEVVSLCGIRSWRIVKKRPDEWFGFKIETKITLVWVKTQELFYELKSEASYGRQGCRRQGN